MTIVRTALISDSNGNPEARFWEIGPEPLEERVKRYLRDNQSFIVRYEEIDTEDPCWEDSKDPSKGQDPESS